MDIAPISCNVFLFFIVFVVARLDSDFRATVAIGRRCKRWFFVVR
jgi:hypothetical protein